MFSLQRHAFKLINKCYKNMEQNMAFQLSFSGSHVFVNEELKIIHG